MSRRIISIVLILALFIVSIPTSVQAEELQAELNSSDIIVEGTNGFGTLLASEITESQEETEEKSEEYEAGYIITDLVIEENIATVTYDSLENVTLVVAIYDEDGLQMLTSGTVEVTSDATEAMVTIEGEMPEYFMASAYLLDNYDMSPLCAAYDTPMYTQEMQELLASTIADYDADKVLNLDEDDSTNFAVFAEETIVIEEQEGVNTITSVDDETFTYVIENADESITSLTKGDIFAYPYGKNEILIVKVTSISVEGTTATISGAELELEEVFSHMKLESTGNINDSAIDESTGDEGVIYLGAVSPLAEGGISDEAKIGFAFDDIDLGGIELSGGLALTAEVEFNYYITWSYQEVEFKLNYSADFEIGLSGECGWCEVKLPEVPVYSVWGLSIGFEPKFIIESKVKVNFSTSYQQQTGFKFSSNSGFSNLSTNPKTATDLSIEGKVFIGIDFCPTIEVAGGSVLDLDASMRAGVSISGETTEAENQSSDVTYQHSCDLCLDGDIEFSLKITPKLCMLKSKNLTFEYEVCNAKVHLLDFYYSFDKDVWGLGTCPNRSFRVVFQVLKNDKTPAESATVKIEETEQTFTANSTGSTVAYLTTGEYTVRADSGELYSVRKIEVDEPEKFTISVILDVDNDGYDDETGESADPLEGIDFSGVLGRIDEEIITDHGVLVGSGNCGEDGDNVKWALYGDGILEITGTGNMVNYSSMRSVPWFEYRTLIYSINIEEGVTSIGGFAFYDCSNLRGVFIPNSIISIGGYAFYACSRLGSVTIPDNVMDIGVYTFYGCSSLSCVVIPEGMTSIGSGAFRDCTRLSSVTIPDSVISMGEHMFNGCDSLNSVTIPDGIVTITNSMFSDCSNLTSVTIPDSVTSIDSYAFSCSGLTSVTIPDGVINIGNSVFERCFGLSSITVPDSVTSINSAAFAYCASLSKIIFLGNAPSLAGNILYKVTATVYYPADNETWTEDIMQDYGGTITWVPYTLDENGDMVTDISVALITATTETGAIEAEAVLETINEETVEPGYSSYSLYPGDYETEITDIYTLKSASFTCLVPTKQYVLLAMKAIDVADPLVANNLLYIDQAVAADEGTLVFQYVQREDTTISYVVACGASNKNLNEAEITFPEMTASEEVQAVNPTVVFDGQILMEGRDYVVIGTVDYTHAGEYTCYIRGIYNYTGLVECNYVVTEETTYLLGDVTGDGKVTAADYSRLLAHVKKTSIITDKYALLCADVTGDGKITAADYSRLLAHVKKVSLLW